METAFLTTSFAEWVEKVEKYRPLMVDIAFPPEAQMIGRYATAPAILVEGKSYIMASRFGNDIHELLKNIDILYMVIRHPQSWTVRGSWHLNEETV